MVCPLSRLVAGRSGVRWPLLPLRRPGSRGCPASDEAQRQRNEVVGEAGKTVCPCVAPASDGLIPPVLMTGRDGGRGVRLMTSVQGNVHDRGVRARPGESGVG